MRIHLFLVLAGMACNSGLAPAAEETPEPSPSVFRSVNYSDESISNILRGIADTYDLNLVIPEGLEGRATLKLQDVTWRQALDILLNPIAYRYREDGNIIVVESLPTHVSSGDDRLELPPELVKLFSSGLVEGLKAILRDEDYADALATFKWNYYQALIRRGFTKEEAMQLLRAEGSGSKTGAVP